MSKSLGHNTPHDSSLLHSTGQSQFVDDRPVMPGEVFVGCVLSTRASAAIKKIDFTKAANHSHFLRGITASDLHHNRWGTIAEEQPLLASDRANYHGEVIALIISSESQSIAEILKLVEVTYGPMEMPTTFDVAIKEKKFLYSAVPFMRGNFEASKKEADHCLSGTFFCGGQEHFYMENQGAVAYPLEDGQIEVHASSQHPSETQHLVAHALGLAFSKVVCIVKRMGGGFGGKESQAAPFAAYAAVAAHLLHRPARCVVTKDEDMAITGKRHPFKVDYQITFNQDGLILGLKTVLFADAGAYTDLSPSILERGMFHIDSAYYLPTVQIEAHACRTNSHSNTAFRGFGGPQGTMAMESIIEDIAAYLNKESSEIRIINCYGKNDRNVTPYGQLFENNFLPEIFKQLLTSSNYKQRQENIESFNQQKNGRVRGIALTPTKFGIAFTARFLNQANAQVNVHLDGTIQASTGATEMGQGVNTKIAQIIAHAFGLGMEHVRMMPTSTEKNHNTSPTAASSGSDLNGAAALLCCQKIRHRLQSLLEEFWANEKKGIKPKSGHEFGLYVKDIEKAGLELGFNAFPHIKFENAHITNSQTGQTISFLNAIKMAYMNRLSLGEYTHYRTPGLGFDKNLVSGKAFNYFTQGAAVSEVEIDEYTGECKVLRTDILMDLGRPINPGIDQGQVTGAFVQAMGWVTSENLYYQLNGEQQGRLISHSPTTYKIPNVQDIPREFHVSFFPNETNTVAVHGSKAVGEPPFLLGISVWCAIKKALISRSRKSSATTTAVNGAICAPWPNYSPATNEYILRTLSTQNKPQA